MALNFPSLPTIGDIYSYNEYSWQWNGTYWESYSTGFNYLPLSGGTVTGSTSFTAGLLASSISATTYENLPSFNYAQINGTTQFSAGTNNYINFSGINITITSASTNTLVLSAGTGGGGSGTISGTVNYIPKFTSSSSIGNSVMTNISNTVYITGSTGNNSVLYVDNNGKGPVAQFWCSGTNANQIAVAGYTSSGSSQIGVYGQAGSGQYGVYGVGIGDTGTVTGVYGRAGYISSTGATFIGGYFAAPEDTGLVNSYAVQLYDYSVGINKVLISKTFDGKANWSDTLTGLTTIGVSTLSATNYQNLPGSSSSNCQTTFYVTNISGCSPINMLTEVNMTSGLTVTGDGYFTGSITSSTISTTTISATTYQNIVASAITNSTTVGQNLITLPNPSAIRYLRINADNSVTSLTLAQLKSDLGLIRSVQANTVTNASSSVTVDITGCTVSLDSNSTYIGRFTIGTGCAGTGGLNLRFSFPSGAVMYVGRIQGTTAVTTQNETWQQVTSGTNLNVVLNGVINQTIYGEYQIYIATAGTSGSLTPSFLTVTNGTTSTVYAFVTQIQLEKIS